MCVVPAGGSVDAGLQLHLRTQPAYSGTNTATATWDKAAYFTPTGTASGTRMSPSPWQARRTTSITVVDDKTDPPTR